MQITCAECKATYNIEDSKIPQKRAVARCKRCDAKITIDPGAPAQHDANFAAGSSADSDISPAISPSAETATDHQSAIFADFPELEKLPTKYFAFDEILFANKKGGYKNRKNKFRVKVIKAVADLMPKILTDNEKVLRIGQGVAYYPAEAIFGNGLFTMLYNYYAIVCTNQRVLFINTDSRVKRPTHYLFQMPYDDIKKIKKGLLFSSLTFKTKNGKSRVFTYMKRYIAKELHLFIKDSLAHTSQEEKHGEILENLCPSCFEPLAAKLIECKSCGAFFKNPRTAFLKSLVLPGWGDIYLGHKELGTLELLGSLIVWAIVIPMLLSGAPESLLVAGFLLLFYHGMDGLLSHHMARKGYMLAQKPA